MQDLTPRQIVEELDKYIVGQAAAKRAVAIALRNRYRRRLLPDELRDEVIPKNILMIGPTGVGKTEIARRLAHLAKAPFVKIEATKFTEVGYVGRDVDSMVRDLVQTALRLVEQERFELVKAEAEQRAIDRIVEILQPRTKRAGKEKDSAEVFRQAFGPLFGGMPTVADEDPEEDEKEAEDAKKQREREDRIRKRLRDQVVSGARDEDKIEIEVETHGQAFVQFFSPQGVEEMGLSDLQSALGNLANRSQKKQRTLSVKDAKVVLTQDEARGLIDSDSVVREAVERAEQSGIIFIDELDKIAGREGGHGPDVSREGVQRDLLPIIEGSTVATKYGPVKTDHVLFIGAGAFHVSKPSDLIPELQGRLPIRVELESLTEADLKRILTEPKNALIRQYSALLGTEGVTLTFADESIDEISSLAAQVNSQSENIGARRLHTVLERLLEDVSFGAPDHCEPEVTIDAAYVRERLAEIVNSEDLSRYIL